MTIIKPDVLSVSDLLYSKYISGSDPAVQPCLTPDRGMGIALDGAEAVYIAGETGSPDFYTTSSPTSRGLYGFNIDEAGSSTRVLSHQPAFSKKIRFC